MVGGREKGCQQSAGLQQQHWGPRAGASQHRLTHQQQQQQQQQKRLHPQQVQPTGVPAGSPRARRIFELYSECVRAGQWASFSVVQRQDGEYITLRIRPLTSVVPAAAVGAKCRSGRKPNLRRKEMMLERWRSHKNKQRKSGTAVQPQQRQQQQQQQRGQQQQPLQAPGSSSSCATPRQQQQLAPTRSRAAAATAAARAAAAAGAAADTATAGTSQQPQHAAAA